MLFLRSHYTILQHRCKTWQTFCLTQQASTFLMCIKLRCSLYYKRKAFLTRNLHEGTPHPCGVLKCTLQFTRSCIQLSKETPLFYKQDVYITSYIICRRLFGDPFLGLQIGWDSVALLDGVLVTLAVLYSILGLIERAITQPHLVGACVVVIF